MTLFFFCFKILKLADFCHLNEADLSEEHMKRAEKKRLAAVLAARGVQPISANKKGGAESERAEGEEKKAQGAPLSKRQLGMEKVGHQKGQVGGEKKVPKLAVWPMVSKYAQKSVP